MRVDSVGIAEGDPARRAPPVMHHANGGSRIVQSIQSLYMGDGCAESMDSTSFPLRWRQRWWRWREAGTGGCWGLLDTEGRGLATFPFFSLSQRRVGVL